MMVPGDQQLGLTWKYATTGTPATELQLDLYSVDGKTPVKYRSVVVGHTVEPDSYLIPILPGTWMVVATPRNSWGAGPATASGAVPVGNSCATATMCVHLSAPATPTKVRLAAQGFLSGTEYSVATYGAKVTALRPQSWRLAWGEASHSARQVGAAPMQVLSTLWEQVTAPQHGGYAMTPWSNWWVWETYVQYLVRRAKAEGWSPKYWDVWNEPNGLCCPKFSPADVKTITVDRWLETYVRAWRAIKTADPTAKIVGPSISELQWAPGAPREFDLDTFLSYSAKNGVTWDAISWHENNTAPLPGDFWGLQSDIDRHIALAKAVLARHPGTVVNNTIILNEYGAKDRHMLAGSAVGYFEAIESGGVSEAHRACWSGDECNTTLDGLFTPNGQTTALWWAHRLYGDLTIGNKMNVTSSASWQLSGLAAWDNGWPAVRALIGRHWGCNRAVNAWCASPDAFPPASVAVTIDWPWGTAPATVQAWILPAGTGALPGPIAAASVVTAPKAGKVTITIPAVNDGDAISILACPM